MSNNSPPQYPALALPQTLYSSAEVRALDQAIIAAGTPGFTLMQRAARAVFDALQLRWPQARSLCVLCGKGNNGGDGYLVARLAAERGYRVDVVELGVTSSSAVDTAALDDAGRARNALLDIGIQPVAGPLSASRFAEIASEADLLVDALLGTGVSGELRSGFAETIAAVNTSGKPVVAVDIPSGISGDSGMKVGDVAVVADLTVSFIGLKRGLFTGDAVGHVGELQFAGLQADPAIVASRPSQAGLCDWDELQTLLPQRAASAFKNHSGHLLVIGGDHGMGGAPLLSASAALRCGTGLVSVASRAEHLPGIIARQPEAMARGIERAEDLSPMLERATAVVAGPGLGTGSWSAQLLHRLFSYLLEQRAMPLLLDADALNLLAARPELRELFDALQQSHPGSTVLTPHPGEAARLAGGKDPDRFALLQKLSARYGGTVVLKGAGTLVGEADRSYVCNYGNPVLATAGTGDVLSGVIGAWLAQELRPLDAAKLGVCLHALAADAYCSEVGPFGLLAGELVEWLVDVLNESAQWGAPG